MAGASSAPAYAYTLDSVRTLPPVWPSVQLNRGNYVEHEEGIASQQQRAGAAPAP